eukprot:TRINITY_DN11737_c0_g1_i1.p1 TRINITY_DN11737_c0_g1~~TRINITY_DN11737_c0_g1_i1.p1  ORF type:complete len:491 (+),score=107.45 TRINITY_DN11737_c0_g1_i1:91-1563(+)
MPTPSPGELPRTPVPAPQPPGSAAIASCTPPAAGTMWTPAGRTPPRSPWGPSPPRPPAAASVEASPALREAAAGGVGVGLEDALQRIRELSEIVRRQEEEHQRETDALRDRLARQEENHLAAQRRLLASARAREQLLIGSDAASVRAAAERDARVAVAEELREAERRAQQLEQEVASLRSQLQSSGGAQRRALSEAALARQAARKEGDEAALLRRALARERQLADEARAAADQAASHSSTTPPRGGVAPSAAAAALGELLGSVRQSCGAGLVDAALHRGLRTCPAVAEAARCGVDVAALLARHLRGFDPERAQLNQRRLLAALGRLQGAAGSPRALTPPPSPPAAQGHSEAAASPPPPQQGGRGDAGSACGSDAMQAAPADPVAEGSLAPSGAEWFPPGSELGGDAAAPQRRRALLQRAVLLQREAQRLRRSRSVESGRWSPPAQPAPRPAAATPPPQHAAPAAARGGAATGQRPPRAPRTPGARPRWGH